MKQSSRQRSIPLALVHHANQYLITENYEQREGISQIVAGYAAILSLHDKYSIPVNLHLSGTLMEAIAWNCPEFFDLVKDLRARQLLSILGGTYSENVMPLFAPDFNRRQLNEHLWLCSHHLECSPADIKLCWVPERVWDTEKLADVITDSTLPNGGYRFVLLDNRIFYPATASYEDSTRAVFDSTGPYESILRPEDRTIGASDPYKEYEPEAAFRIHRIEGAKGLAVVPISADLRYWIPPRSPDDLNRLGQLVDSLIGNHGDDTVLVYADDLEKTAGVGGWESGAIERYEGFLHWLTGQDRLSAVLLADWLSDRPIQHERKLEAGTFFELAQQWNAGEDYRKWWDSAGWSPYRACIEAAEEAISAAGQAGADGRLLDLACKHLMASTYETAWYDSMQAGYAPAPWAKAISGHARSSLVIAAAARWFGQAERMPCAQMLDIDQDGEEEVVLKSEFLYAVFTPSHGGRLMYLFVLTQEGGAMMIGNPTDDWNFQEELNRYMDWPANHPGALADFGHVHDRYEVSSTAESGAHLELTNIEIGSSLFGTRKSVMMIPDVPALLVRYELPAGVNNLEVDSCLSPDYYRLLREGRHQLDPLTGRTWSGIRNNEVSAWIALAPDEDTNWADSDIPEPGHGVNVRMQGHSPQFHVLIGSGDIEAARCHELMETGRNSLQRIGEKSLREIGEVQI